MMDPSDASQVPSGKPTEPKAGYKNPPKHAQFKRGKSGNPKGRAKGSKNLETIVREEGTKKVTVNGPKGQRIVTITQAIVMQMAAKAARGDRQSQRDFLAMYAKCEETWAARDDESAILQSDQLVLESLAKRIRSYTAGANGKSEKEIPES
jgi:hypothetical protein